MAYYHVAHLHSAEAVDDAINREGETTITGGGGRGGRLAVVRFGRGGAADCARVDAAMAAAAERVGPIAALIAVDIDEVQDFNVMYELEHTPCTLMFFYGFQYVDVRGFGSADYRVSRNNWAAIAGADEFAAVVETVHERAAAGCRIVDF